MIITYNRHPEESGLVYETIFINTINEQAKSYFNWLYHFSFYIAGLGKGSLEQFIGAILILKCD